MPHSMVRPNTTDPSLAFKVIPVQASAKEAKVIEVKRVMASFKCLYFINVFGFGNFADSVESSFLGN